MLYHRLLSTLISNDFDFPSFWKRLGLDPQKELSARFQAQSGLIFSSGSDGSRMNCLDGLVRLWNSSAQILDVDGIDRTLVLVYRAQRNYGHGKKKRKRRARGRACGDLGDLSMSKEDADIARAIAESMKYVTGAPEMLGTRGDDDFAAAIAESLKDHAMASVSQEDENTDLDLLTEGKGLDGSLPDDVADEPSLLWALQQPLVHQLKKGAFVSCCFCCKRFTHPDIAFTSLRSHI